MLIRSADLYGSGQPERDFLRLTGENDNGVAVCRVSGVKREGHEKSSAMKIKRT